MASGSGAEATLVHVPKGLAQPASDRQTDEVSIHVLQHYGLLCCG